MAMSRERKIKVTEQLVNLTGDAIYLYDDASGEIEEFLPVDWFENPKLDMHGHPRLYYVVCPSFLERLQEIGRPLDDIVVVFKTGLGRGNALVSYLRSAKDDEMIIRYQRPVHFRAA